MFNNYNVIFDQGIPELIVFDVFEWHSINDHPSARENSECYNDWKEINNREDWFEVIWNRWNRFKSYK